VTSARRARWIDEAAERDEPPGERQNRRPLVRGEPRYGRTPSAKITPRFPGLKTCLSRMRTTSFAPIATTAASDAPKDCGAEQEREAERRDHGASQRRRHHAAVPVDQALCDDRGGERERALLGRIAKSRSQAPTPRRLRARGSERAADRRGAFRGLRFVRSVFAVYPHVFTLH